MKRTISINYTIIVAIVLSFIHRVTPFLASSKYQIELLSKCDKNDGGNESMVMDRNAFMRNLGVKATSIVVGSSLIPSAVKAEVPKTDVTAPSFELPNSNGGTTTLSDLTKTGKWTVLYFYPGAFTNGCTLEARGFQRDIDQYKKLNSQVVGVSVDEVGKNAKFCQQESLDFYVLSDRGGAVSRKYGSVRDVAGFGSYSERQTYLLDPKGDLKWIFEDVEGRIMKHSTEVLEKLVDLQKV